MVTSKDENPDGKRPLVSIIIPVFNASEFLGSCIESVLRQTYANLEVIVIDDGSEDGSRDLIREYTQKDGRIVAVFQENAGVSVARNHGIGVARGEYLTFVDADDWLESEAVESMVDTMIKQDVDCVRTQARVVNDGTTTYLGQGGRPGRYSGAALRQLGYETASGAILCYVWLLLIRKSALNESFIRFPHGISMMEDAWFYNDLISAVNSLYISSKVTYNYRVNNTGATRSTDGFLEKVTSIIAVDKHLREGLLDTTRGCVISAINSSIIANMVTVRADNAGIEDIRRMLQIVEEAVGAAAMYDHGSSDKLSTYKRVEAWTVFRGGLIFVILLKYLRKLRAK